MTQPLKDKYRRISFRLDKTTEERLDAVARVLASRSNAAKPSRTAALRFVGQLAAAFDDATYRDLHRILAKLQTGPDRTGTIALTEALKFAIRVAAAAVEMPPAAVKR